MAADATLNAARRLTFGPSASLLSEIRALGVSAWVEQQLNYTAIDDLAVEALIAPYAYAGLPPIALVQDSDHRQAVEQQRSAVMIRQIASKRHLFEVMAEFWANHFSIDGSNYAADKWRAWDDRTVVRQHALGAFPDMLNGSAHSPSMLNYLNNAVSAGREPNENYARELLELHTVGVHGGYTEDDVHQAALALTGWSVDNTTASFKFKRPMHYVGPLKVMGWKHSNTASDGEAVGQSLINYLGTHPQTARHLAQKLVRRFVSDNPPGGLGNKVAASLRDSGFQIPAAIRTIVSSKEFLSSESGKYKRPAEWVVGAFRALGSTPNFNPFPADTLPALYPLYTLGQVPFGWTPPNGYPDLAEAWESTAQTVSRWNIARQIAYNGINSMSGYQAATLLGSPTPATVGDLVDRLAVQVLGRSAGVEERAALIDVVGRPAGAGISPVDAKAQVPELVALLLSSPTMQVR